SVRNTYPKELIKKVGTTENNSQNLVGYSKLSANSTEDGYEGNRIKFLVNNVEYPTTNNGYFYNPFLFDKEDKEITAIFQNVIPDEWFDEIKLIEKDYTSTEHGVTKFESNNKYGNYQLGYFMNGMTSDEQNVSSTLEQLASKETLMFNLIADFSKKDEKLNKQIKMNRFMDSSSYTDQGLKVGIAPENKPNGSTTFSNIIFEPNYFKLYKDKTLVNQVLIGLSKDKTYMIKVVMIPESKGGKLSIDAELFNLDASSKYVNLEYLQPLEIRGDISKDKSVDKRSVAQSLGENKGVYIETPGRTDESMIQTRVEFDPDFGPNNWIIFKGDRDRIHPDRYNRGSGAADMNKRGMETGYTLYEAPTRFARTGDIYPRGMPFYVRHGSSGDQTYIYDASELSFKTLPQKVSRGESVKMKWRVAIDEVENSKPTDSFYRKFDTDLEKEDMVLQEKVRPVKIDTSAIDDVMEFEQYLFFNTVFLQDQYAKFIEAVPGQPTSTNGSFYNANPTSFSLPKIVSFKKNELTKVPISTSNPISYSFLESVGGADKYYGGSGVGFIQTDPNTKRISRRIDTINISDGSIIDEFYLSKDKKKAVIYGRQYLADGSVLDSMPIKLTLESIGNKGKVKMSYKYMNTSRFEKGYRALYTIHMDISGAHAKSTMYTLGNKKGLFFKQQKLNGSGTHPDITSDETTYYATFYADSFGEKVDMNVTNLNISDTTIPASWKVFNGIPTTTPDYIDGKAGEEIWERDNSTGRIQQGVSNPHPAWYFAYPEKILES
ncbi:MAG: hypothetical protein RR536_08100, partial [Anaerovoracaceae bacterium]